MHPFGPQLLWPGGGTGKPWCQPDAGVRQRIGVARAFLHDAPFLLLDEPTSNLDSLNEGVILKAVRAECKDKTVLLVSHRKSTMAAADISFLVESGRLS